MRDLLSYQSVLALIYANDRRTFIRWTYRILLGRDPDNDGRSAYLAALEGGMDRLDILSDIYRSREFSQLESPSPTLPPDLYVRLAYRRELLRDPDENGLHHYLSELANKRISRLAIRHALSRSDEATNSPLIKSRRSLLKLLSTYSDLQRNPLFRLLKRPAAFRKDAFLIGTLGAVVNVVEAIQADFPAVARTHSTHDGTANLLTGQLTTPSRRSG